MSLSGQTLGVIGAGVMGQALIRALLDGKVFSTTSLWATARTQSSCDKLAQTFGIIATSQYETLLPKTDILLLCVKPASLGKVVKTLKTKGLRPETVVISIVAGKSLAMLETLFESSNPVIRAMPNTPCIVRQGMTAICGSESVTAEQMGMAQQIFESVGQCLELEEQHFDAVTGLGGSGPAYIYLMIEALADGGVRVGLPRDIAMKIVTQTVLGAASMVQETGRHPAALRDDVTTPAGCTIAGLLVMEDGKIRSTLARAVEEATQTASGLGNT